jgi:hypothetical protein
MDQLLADARENVKAQRKIEKLETENENLKEQVKKPGGRLL